jgi:short subunit dehydrogenase-like uncharacterized protein
MTSSVGPDRDHDVVLYGATGFVGRLTAEYLAASAPRGARIALAGRSQERLAQVRDGLGAAAAAWPLVVADSADRDQLDAMARSTRVVVTTVGPYAKYGMPLVQACAAAGTAYADLTGEVLFVRESIDRAHDTAVASGARIVHACGFDSIPSDLGVLLAAERAAADGEGELTDTTLVLVSASGGISGGTIDSLRTQVDAARSDADKRRTAADPYALSPDRSAEPYLGDESDQVGPHLDPQLGRWTAPFVMAPFNTRIVRRSNALAGYAYGRSFRYREVMGVGRTPLSPVLAAATAVGTAGFAAGMAFPPARALLDRVLPKPGSGPSEWLRRNGHFRLQVHATTVTGARYVTTVAAKGDPGYGATAVMLGESGLCLALDGDRLPDRAGVLTPATAMGSVLAERLRAAGFTLDVARA